MNIKPILAAPLLPPSVEHTNDIILAEMKRLHYPVLATLKKDGIRALRLSGKLLSRTFKAIPNKHLREEASLILPGGFDMELWNKGLEYHDVESIVMSQQHANWKLIEFHILDWISSAPSYVERCYHIATFMRSLVPELQSRVKFSPPVECHNAEQLFTFFLTVEEELGEGICFRTPTSPYKYGRSTLREQYLVKLCRNVTAEAEIIGFEEQMENTNRAHWNSVGKMDRSSSKEGLVGKDTLGSMLVRDINTGLEFNIGTGVGLTDELRKEIWDNMEKYSGRIITYKCKQHGQKVKPRSPIFKGFRDPIDL